ncbi:hypothetical protein PRIPAC_81546 [Pristionchus pacificus]|nr:hypothetical protein PRIPAC_81546 [Pristionchus pacificus]
MQLAQVTTWIELTISVGATPLALLVLYALLTSSLNRRVKVFLTMNGLGLLFLTTSHVSVAVYRIMKPVEWHGLDVVANVPLFLHQLAYSSCTVAQFLITIERMIIGLNPRLYVEKKVAQWTLITLCVIFEILVALPCTMLFQDGPTVNGNKLYRSSELSQKISLLILALLDVSALVCCTATAIVEPILLLTRHRLLQRRVRILMGLPVGEVIQADVRDSVAIADVYFNAFKKELNKKMTG